jgi:pimeloyl-ACP methyl ester carboxylesterase
MPRLRLFLKLTQRRPAMMALKSPRALRLTWWATRLAAPVSRRLAGRLAARLWFTPWPVDSDPKARARHARWLAGTDPYSAVTSYGNLAAFSAGTGPLVILVHGWGERAGTMGALVRPLADAGFRVVGVDLPAHGDDPTTQTDALILAATVREIAAQAGDVHAVVAHSMGSLTTIIALQEGLTPRKVALIAPATRIGRNMDAFAQMFGLSGRAVRGLRETIERRYGRDVWTALDGVNAARRLTIPALVVHDEDDPQVPYGDGVALAAAWPGARLVTTNGLGHTRLLGDETVIREVIEHLRGAKGPLEDSDHLDDRAGEVGDVHGAVLAEHNVDR